MADAALEQGPEAARCVPHPAFTKACTKQHEPSTSSSSGASGKGCCADAPGRDPVRAQAAAIVLCDLPMVVFQLLLAINHIRRWLDISECRGDNTAARALLDGPLAGYPCNTSALARIFFLLARAGSTYWACMHLPLGELWVPLVSTVLLGQLTAIALLPMAYVGTARRPFMFIVGIIPKVASLASLLLWPEQQPSTYFSIYFPCEGVIMVWQQLMYNYPFWQGLFVVACHCILSVVCCIVVPPSVGVAPFSPAWVLVQTFSGAVFAMIALLHRQPLAMIAGQGRKRAHRETSSRLPGHEQLSVGEQRAAVAKALLAAQMLQASNSCTSCSDGECSSSATTSGSNEEAAKEAKRASAAALSVEPAMDACATPALAASYGIYATEQANSGLQSVPKSHVAMEQTRLQAMQHPALAHTAAPALAGEFGAASAGFTLDRTRRPDTAAWPYNTMTAVAPCANGLISGGAPISMNARAQHLPAAAPAPVLQSRVNVPMRPPTKPSSPASEVVPPSATFSLKQPKGLSTLTIRETEEFDPPDASASVAYIMHLASTGARNTRYVSRAAPQRVYMKIPWAEPNQLPGNFLERLNVALSNGWDCMAVGATARAGCIELVLDVVGNHAGAFPSGGGQLMNLHKLDGVSIEELATAAVVAAKAAAISLQGCNEALDIAEQSRRQMLVDEVTPAAAAIPDLDPTAWIEVLHLQPPPGAKILTQACGRVWVSCWDEATRQWIPERAGFKPHEVPRIMSLDPLCCLLSPDSCATQLSLTVSSTQQVPAFSARCRGRYLPVLSHTGFRSSAEPSYLQDPASAGAALEPACEGDAAIAAAVQDDSRVRIEIAAGLPRNGLVVVECKLGMLLSNWRPLVVTEDAELAQELRELQEGGEDAGCDELLTDLGLWLDYAEVTGLMGRPEASMDGAQPSMPPAWAAAAHGGASSLALAAAVSCGRSARLPTSCDFSDDLASLYRTERYRQHMASIGVSLLEFAVDRGWCHTASCLHDQLLASAFSWEDILQRCSGGLTLLHRAVRSTCAPMVDLVVRWGEAHGKPFDWQACMEDDVRGITPLHLAAALPDGGALAERILSEYKMACEVWDVITDPHGCRPLDFASAVGNAHLPEMACVRGSADVATALPRVAAPTAMAKPGQQPALNAQDHGMAAKGGAPYGSPAGSTGDHGSVSCSSYTSYASSVLGAGAAPGVTCAGAPRTVQLRRGRTALGVLLQRVLQPMHANAASERAYLVWVGQRTLPVTCVWVLLNVIMVTAVAGRMLKEGRVHQVWGMLIFCTPHVVSLLLLITNVSAFLARREALTIATSVTRTLAKVLPVLGLLPYPHSSSSYMLSGMDIMVEGVLASVCEQVRSTWSLGLRLLEGVVTGVLYVRLGISGGVAGSLLYGIGWHLVAGVLTALLDLRSRVLFTASGAAGGASGARPARGKWSSGGAPGNAANGKLHDAVMAKKVL